MAAVLARLVGQYGLKVGRAVVSVANRAMVPASVGAGESASSAAGALLNNKVSVAGMTTAAGAMGEIISSGGPVSRATNVNNIEVSRKFDPYQDKSMEQLEYSPYLGNIKEEPFFLPVENSTPIKSRRMIPIEDLEHVNLDYGRELSQEQSGIRDYNPYSTDYSVGPGYVNKVVNRAITRKGRRRERKRNKNRVSCC